MGPLFRSADGDSSMDMFDGVRLLDDHDDDVDILLIGVGLIDGLFAKVKALTAKLLLLIRLVLITRDNWRRKK